MSEYDRQMDVVRATTELTRRISALQEAVKSVSPNQTEELIVHRAQVFDRFLREG